MDNYLYGDSTPSPLTSNFLEFLRDALDFAVFVLRADEQMADGAARAAGLTEQAEAELARLDAFVAVVSSSIESADQGPEDSATARYASRLSDLIANAQRATADGIRNKLAADIAAIDAEESAVRDACVDALQTLLRPHEPPASSLTEHVVLEGARYAATLHAQADLGLAWAFQLTIPEASVWSSPVRLDRISDHLEARVPQMSGWIKKEVKALPLKLDRHVVTELTASGSNISFKLRLEPAFDTGLDVEVDRDQQSLRMTRVSGAEDAGPFDVDSADVAPMIALATKLVGGLDDVARTTLAHAQFDDADFRTLPTFAAFVERLVATLAPITREIAKRSITPTELVLRRALGGDRREELFMTKATLREKYAGLAAPLRAVFAPLGLEVTTPSVPPPARPAPPASRAEVPRSSHPPPPLPKPPLPAPSPEGKRETFVEAVKKIVLVLKSGRTDEGYTQYAALLAGPAFAEYQPEDQRQALKLLLLAKTPPSRSDAVMEAYRVALSRIQTLVDALADPADYEMLGVAQLHLDEKAAASAAFEIALKLERARDPSSELCGSLARRVSQLSS